MMQCDQVYVWFQCLRSAYQFFLHTIFSRHKTAKPQPSSPSSLLFVENLLETGSLAPFLAYTRNLSQQDKIVRLEKDMCSLKCNQHASIVFSLYFQCRRDANLRRLYSRWDHWDDLADYICDLGWECDLDSWLWGFSLWATYSGLQPPVWPRWANLHLHRLNPSMQWAWHRL